MITSNKIEFLRRQIEPLPKDLDILEINLDETDLGIADILRNINIITPTNSRERNEIASGFKVLGILCTSELLKPMSGLLLFIVGGNTVVKLASKKYIIMSINEERLSKDSEIAELLDEITMYMISSYRRYIAKFEDFYIKFIFDDYENEFYDF